jgi:hypothetical protein
MAADVIAGYAAIVATLAILIPIWQARRARAPRVELQLIHTRIEGIRTITLEIRNRGEYPVRIISAGIDSPTIALTFTPGALEISHETIYGAVAIKSDDQQAMLIATNNQMSPVPGIIVPRDGGGRFVADSVLADVAATFQNNSKLSNDLREFVDQELRGCASVTTGEFLRTKPVKFDWVNFKAI